MRPNNRKNLKFCMALMMMACLCTGCSGVKKEVDCDASSWIKRPDRYMSFNVKPLTSDRYTVLTGAALGEAIELLKSDQFIELTPQLRKKLDLNDSAGRIFLMRAVAYDMKSGGSWNIREKDGRLEISWGVLTRQDPKLICQAVAISLDQRPLEVFLYADIAS